MQRLNQNTPFAVQPDEKSSPALAALPDAAGAVPESFADWLSQPTCNLAPDAATEQGIFLELLNQRAD